MHILYAFVNEQDEVVNVAVCEDDVDPQTLWPTATLRRIAPPAGIGWTWNATTNTFDPPYTPAPTP